MQTINSSSVTIIKHNFEMVHELYRNSKEILRLNDSTRPYSVAKPTVNLSYKIQNEFEAYKSSMPLTDLARRNDSFLPCCIQTSTVSMINWWPRPSSVYNTDRPPKLTATGMISRSRGVAGVHQNLNGSRDTITPPSGTVCHPWYSTCYDQPIHEIWSLNLHSLRT